MKQHIFIKAAEQNHNFPKLKKTVITTFKSKFKHFLQTHIKQFVNKCSHLFLIFVIFVFYFEANTIHKIPNNETVLFISNTKYKLFTLYYIYNFIYKTSNSTQQIIYI